MRNYVIINGANSLNITGLAIKELPSISKPPKNSAVHAYLALLGWAF